MQMCGGDLELKIQRWRKKQFETNEQALIYFN